MPPRGRKRKSEQSVASGAGDAPIMTTATAAGQKIATKTSSAEDSPRKRQKTGLTAAQKQALIDNLQLEVTERARKLRAQYSLQAQGLRTRIEIRVNRIPTALRKLKMGDLLLKHAADQLKPMAPGQAIAYSSTTRSAAPPVPEKDYHTARPVASRGDASPRAAVGRPFKRLSDQLAGGDKENQNAQLDPPKKRQRAGNAPAATHPAQSAQVLSPASSNSRLNPRERAGPAPAPAPSSPIKSFIARPMSPTKPSTSLLSSMVEKARATRAAATRKPTTSSTASSAVGGSSRARAKAAATASTAASAVAARPASRATAAAAARNARRISGTSESSDASTSTVVRKVGRPAGTTASSGARKTTGTAAASTAKKASTGASKKSVASAATKKAPATKAAAAATTAAPAATTRSGRILRKRD